MKRLIFTALASLVMLCAKAQNCTPTISDYANFSNTKTLIVLDDDMFSDFNMTVKECAKSQNWPTELSFCKRSDFLNNKRKDPQYSFIVTTTVTYPNDKSKTKYTYLSLLMGKKVPQVTNMPDLISIPLAYDRVHEQKWACMLPAFMRFMLAHVDAMKADPKLISETPLLRYNKNKGSLASKTLYLLKSDLDTDLQTMGAVKAVYPYDFRFVTKEEMAEAINSKDPDVVFLHKVGPEDNSRKSYCFKIIMGAADATIYYFDYHTITLKDRDALRAKDLKSIGKQ